MDGNYLRKSSQNERAKQTPPKCSKIPTPLLEKANAPQIEKCGGEKPTPLNFGTNMRRT